MYKPLMQKLAIIFGIALFILIVLMSISGTVMERKDYLSQAREQVARSWTGSQTLFGPVLVVAYEYPELDSEGKQTSVTGRLNFMPRRLNHKVRMDTQIRYQGIYEVPVYTSQIQISGEYDKQEIEERTQSLLSRHPEATVYRPFIGLGLKDARGIDQIPTLNWGEGESQRFAPGSRIYDMSQGLHANLPQAWKNQPMVFEFELALRGMDDIEFVPFAREYALSMQANWQAPSFNGDFLPVTRAINQDGFEAQWRVNGFASNMMQVLSQCNQDECFSHAPHKIGVSLLTPVDVYLKSERALKYGILFVGLVFATFFIFENIKGLRIHPVQYALVGMAISVFYLLLLSLSEHMAFGIAYLVATFGCVSLITYYLAAVLKNAQSAYVLGGLLSLLYLSLFVIINAEGAALLMGASLVFIVLGMIMVFSRHIDWYKVSLPSNQ